MQLNFEAKVYEDAEDGLGPLTVAWIPPGELSEDKDRRCTPKTISK